jgi:hypothetical protein
MFENLLGGYRGSVEVIKTKSAMNPLLALCVICEVPFIVGALRSTGLLQAFFALMCILPLLASIVAYFIFMFRDPGRLQSEEYQLQHEAMIQASKGHGVLPESLNVIDHQQAHTIDSEMERPDTLGLPDIGRTSLSQIVEEQND